MRTNITLAEIRFTTFDGGLCNMSWCYSVYGRGALYLSDCFSCAADLDVPFEVHVLLQTDMYKYKSFLNPYSANFFYVSHED